jgi:tetratricopeptide (TPR) repeat protein
MGSTPVSDTDGIEQRLTHTLRCLVEEGNHRGVVRLVERWAQQGGLTQDALIGQAQAFMALRLMDRAWVRLQEARERGPDNVDVQLLTAEMFIDRGWPARARRILERIPVEDTGSERLDRLRQAAAQPPAQPPENAQEVERTGDAEALLGLAERYLAAGSFMRAESLLERLIREGSGTERVSDLLWGIRGEYISQKQSTEDLLRELSPDDWLSEWEGIDRTESLRAVEDTVHDPEAAARSLLGESGDRGDGRPAFPNLFRRDGTIDDTTLGDEDEVTVASQMATVEQMGDAPAQQHTDPGISQTGDGNDTRIMTFITKDGQLGDVDGPIHRKVEPRVKSGVGLGSTLDLRAQSDGLLDPDGFLEEEDQDLIVMTRRERSEAPARSRSTIPVPLVDRRTETDVPLPRRSEDVVSRRPDRSARPERLMADPDTDDLLGPRRRKRRRMLQLLAMAGLAGLVVVIVGWALVFGLHRMAGHQVVEETHAGLASGVFRTVQELEAKLENQVGAEREPYATRVVELAMVRIFLWADYTGDTERLVAAQDGLQWARNNGAPPEEVALATGFLRLAMGDGRSAQMHAATVDTDSALGRELIARVVLARAQPQLMDEAWQRIRRGSAATTLGERLAAEGLATALGHVDQAAQIRTALLAEHSENPFVQLARFERGWTAENPRKRLTALSAVMSSQEGKWSPRQESRFHAARARILAEMGLDTLAMGAWQKALIVDPTHPVYLYIAAGASLWQGKVLSALDDLNRCLGGRPWDGACRRGTIQALIDLDRLQTARQTVDSWRAPGESVDHLDAWVSLAEGKNGAALELLAAGGSDGTMGTGLASYVQGMAMTRLGNSGADAMLEGVVSHLADSPDPLDRILAARAEAARMPLNDSSVARRLEARAIEIAPSDPVVHLEIGRYYETHRRHRDASDAFDLAARRGAENARAHHARGLFYFDPKRDMRLARVAWRRYMDLQPDGERADRIRSRMGWR